LTWPGEKEAVQTAVTQVKTSEEEYPRHMPAVRREGSNEKGGAIRMTIQPKRGAAFKRRRSVTPVVAVLGAMLMVAGLCSTAFASTRSSAVSSAPKATSRWCDYHAGLLHAGDNTEMVAFIKQFEAANPVSR